MMTAHRQVAIRTLRLMSVRRRLQRPAQSHRDLLLQLGFQLIQKPHDEHPQNLPDAPILQPNHLDRNATARPVHTLRNQDGAFRRVAGLPVVVLDDVLT